MNHVLRAVLLTVPIVLLGPSACAIHAASSKLPAVTYEDAERTAYFVFSDGVGEHGEIQPLKPTDEQSRQFTESLGSVIYDCSNDEYRCLRTWFRIFAVPRKGLANGAVHIVSGVKLKIEECLRESDKVCQVALVRSDCELMIGVDECGSYPRGRAESPRPGPVTYFIYNEDYGVTAFGTAGEPATSAEQRLRVATQYILQGRAGLLRATLTTLESRAR